MKITEIYDLSMYPKGTIFYGVNYPTLKGKASKEVGFAHFNY